MIGLRQSSIRITTKSSFLKLMLTRYHFGISGSCNILTSIFEASQSMVEREELNTADYYSRIHIKTIVVISVSSYKK